MMKQNISFIHNCYGCGVCAASCGKKIISIELNEDGFYEPKILNNIQCSNCGICVEVCAFAHQELANQNSVSLKSWAAWSNDENVHQKCSSGGVGFEIGKQLIEQGYHIVGCRYDIQKQRAEHYIATTVEGFVHSIGSKYIQSYTVDAFKMIKRKHQKYLVIGTPCQIDSFRRMIRKFQCEDNFVLIDFYCHCVPSMWAWKAYIKMLEPQIGHIIYASWRNKFEYSGHDSWIMSMDEGETSNSIDWHDSYNLLIKGEKGFIQSRKSQGDLFYKLFLGDICLGPQCENQCKYKYDKSSADIRIGDLWGKTYEDNQKGVSALVAFTEKGYQIVKSLKNITLVEHPFKIVSEGQMRENAHAKMMQPIVMNYLRNGWPIDSCVFRLILFVQKVINKVNSMVKK